KPVITTITPRRCWLGRCTRLNGEEYVADMTRPRGGEDHGRWGDGRGTRNENRGGKGTGANRTGWLGRCETRRLPTWRSRYSRRPACTKWRNSRLLHALRTVASRCRD